MAENFYSNEEDFTAQRSVGYLVKRVHKLGCPRVEALFTDHELSFAQWVTLTLLRDGVADNCAKLARCMGYNSGAVTRLVDQLEERGLIARCRDCGDRRIVTLTLTPAGAAATDAMRPRLMAFWNTMLDGIPAKDVDTLIRTLTIILARLEEDEA